MLRINKKFLTFWSNRGIIYYKIEKKEIILGLPKKLIGDRMGDLSANFSRREFKCKCGKCRNYDTVDSELIRLVEIVRMLNNNIGFSPTSGHRCPDHNFKVKGGSNSLHLVGRAADCPVKNPVEVYYALTEMFPDKWGFGVYPTFIHVDTRSDGVWRKPYV